MKLNRFDEEAARWDEKPERVDLARAVGAAISRTVGLNPSWRVLDYGAGTGLLTLCIQPHVASMTALDTSEGMASALSAKLASSSIKNVQVRLWDLAQHPYPECGFDLVMSSMTMHHIRDVPLVIRRMVDILKPGGCLALADLDAEDGSFHATKEDVCHGGFDRNQITRWFSEAGLVQTAIHDAHQLSKPGPDGGMRSYGVFLAVGRKMP